MTCNGAEPGAISCSISGALKALLYPSAASSACSEPDPVQTPNQGDGKEAARHEIVAASPFRRRLQLTIGK
jgi:hypothetical protein